MHHHYELTCMLLNHVQRYRSAVDDPLKAAADLPIDIDAAAFLTNEQKRNVRAALSSDDVNKEQVRSLVKTVRDTLASLDKLIAPAVHQHPDLIDAVGQVLQDRLAPHGSIVHPPQMINEKCVQAVTASYDGKKKLLLRFVFGERIDSEGVVKLHTNAYAITIEYKDTTKIIIKFEYVDGETRNRLWRYRRLEGYTEHIVEYFRTQEIISDERVLDAVTHVIKESYGFPNPEFGPFNIRLKEGGWDVTSPAEQRGGRH